MKKFRSEIIEDPPIVSLWNEIKKLKLTDLIDLGQGISKITPTDDVLNELKKLLNDPKVYRYSKDPGLPELRSLLSKKLYNDIGINYDADSEIILTAGANQGFMTSILSILNVGEDVIIPTPYYFNQKMGINFASGNVIEVPVDPKSFQPDVSSIESKITEKTHIIVLVSPNNPTGAVYTKDTLKQIAEVAEKYDLIVFSDETYRDFTYDIPYTSIASIKGMKERTVILGSFSKVYGLAGWRIGYLATSELVMSEIMKGQDTIAICAPVISQYAALYSMKYMVDIVEKERNYLNNVRKKMLDILQDTPHIEINEPKGAFYFFPRVTYKIKSEKLVLDIVQKAGVVTLPGSVFGKAGEGHFRLSYGPLSEEKAIEASERIRKYFESVDD